MGNRVPLARVASAILVLATGGGSCRPDEKPSSPPSQPVVEIALKEEEKRLSQLGLQGIVIAEEEEDIRVPRSDAENSVINLIERTRQKQLIDPYPEETAQLYAEWSGVSTEELLFLNEAGGPQYGRKYALSLTHSELSEFMKRREMYWSDRSTKHTENYHVSIVDYTVKRGDSLVEIATKNKVPLWLLVRYNRAYDPRKLQPGQVLMLPVLKEREVVEEEGRAIATAMTPDEQLGDHVHRILMQKGEKVYLFARWAGIDLEDIKKANPGVDLNVVRVGQKLVLPCSPKQFVEFQKRRDEYNKR